MTVKGKVRQVLVSAQCPFCKQENTNSAADFDDVPIQKESNCKHWQQTNIKTTAKGIEFIFNKNPRTMPGSPINFHNG